MNMDYNFRSSQRIYCVFLDYLHLLNLLSTSVTMKCKTVCQLKKIVFIPTNFFLMTINYTENQNGMSRVILKNILLKI
jgi:hypothetical protein